MKISIEKGTVEHLEACAQILEDSVLGQKYFLNRNKQYIGQQLLREGFEKGEIYIALTETGECVGFAWIILNGIFHWFPFLHVVAVKRDARGNGIGKQLMAFFEELGFVQDKSSKLFLCVDSFSTEAIGLYKALGYQEVGPIPDMFVPGVTTFLMMKTRMPSATNL